MQESKDNPELEALVKLQMDGNDSLDSIEKVSEANVVETMKTKKAIEELEPVLNVIAKNTMSKEVQKIKIEGIEAITIKGDKGDKPEKGKDYFTKEEIEGIKKNISDTLKKEITPRKGYDYFTRAEINDIVDEVFSKIPTPKDGKDGRTPQRGVDYFTDADIRNFIYDVVVRIPKPLNGKDADEDKIVNKIIKKIPQLDTPEELANKLNTLTKALDWSVLRGVPDMMGWGSGLNRVFTDEITIFGTGLADNPLRAVVDPLWQRIGTDLSPLNVGDSITTTGVITGSEFNIEDGDIRIYKDGSDNLTLEDSVTGTKTLAQLAAGGGGITDHNLLNNLNWANAGHTFDTDLVLGAFALTLAEISTPSNPSANGLKVYAVDDSGTTKLATLDSAGTETILGAGGGGAVDSVFSRTGVVVAEQDDYTWEQINKSISDIADITNRSHTDLQDIGVNTHAQIDTFMSATYVNSFNTRTGVVTAATNDYTWAQINKATSSIADITTRSHTLLTDIGTNTHAEIDDHIDTDTTVHASATNLVFVTGNQTINGVKTFVDFPEKSGDLIATDPEQFVTFQHLSNLVQGIGSFKQATLATTGNITLSGEQTIDGVLTSTTRVLVWQQTDPIENGIYVSNSSSWTRATDFDEDSEVIGGTAVSVVGGGTMFSSALFVQTEATPEVGVDPLVFVQLPAAKPITASLGVQRVGDDFRADLSGTGAIQLTGNSLLVAVDDSSIERNSNALRVKASGITNAMLAGSIDLTTKVTGDLPFANLAQGSALSVLGVTGNSTADVASIVAASDHQVLRRSGTAVAFGAVNLAQSAAVTGELPNANLANITTAGKVSGAALTSLASTPSGAGVMPVANLGTGTPDGTKFLRDDGVFVTPTGGGGEADFNYSIIPLNSTASSVYTYTNLPVALAAVPPVQLMIKANLSSAVQYRIVARQNVAGFAGSTLRAQFSTTSFSAGWNDLGDEGNIGDLAVGTGTGVKEGVWENITAQAQQDVWIAVSGYGGNATIDPTFQKIQIELRQNSSLIDFVEPPASDVIETSLPFHAHASTNGTWTIPVALGELAASTANRKKYDLSRATYYRIMLDQVGGGFAGSDINVRWTTNPGLAIADWNTLDTANAGETAIGTGAGIKLGNWAPIVTGAKQDVYLAIVGKNGNGSTATTFRQVEVQLRSQVYGQGVGGDDTQLLYNDNGAVAGADVFYVSGNLGINVAAPEKLLHVQGDQSQGVSLFERLTTATDAVAGTMQIKATSSGDMTDGFGSAFNFYIEDTAASANYLGDIRMFRDGADNSGRFQISLADAGVTSARLVLIKDGTLALAGTTTSPARLGLEEENGSSLAYLEPASLTTDRTILIPDADGTMALTTDITLDQAYNGDKTITIDDGAIVFDQNDSTSTILSFDLDTTYSGLDDNGADRVVWNESLVTVTADSQLTQTGHNVDINWDWSGLGLFEFSTLNYTYFDLDFTQNVARNGFGLSNVRIFDVDLYTPAAGANYFIDFKRGGAGVLSLAHDGTMILGGAFSSTTLAVSSTSTFTGLATFNGGIDVNGTSQLDGTLTVGVNDTGHDVTFFGATSGRRFLWDESADLLDLSGALTVTNGLTTLAAATTAMASLNIPAGTAPTSPVEGDIWLDTTDNALQSFTDGLKGSYMRTLGVMTTNRTVANTTATVSLNQAANEGLVTIPANGMAIGRSYKIDAWGFYGTTGTPTLEMMIRFGTTALATTGPQTMASGVSNGMWHLEGIITIRTLGSSGTAWVQGFNILFTGGVVGAGQVYDLERLGTNTINTTTTNDINIAVDWGTMSSSNTITMTNYTLTELQLP